MNLTDYGLSPGKLATSIVVEVGSSSSALAEIAAMAFKNGEQTFSRMPAELLCPTRRPFNTVRRFA